MQQQPNSFTSYKLTADEAKRGAQLNTLNLAVIQNLLASITEEKLNLPFTPNDIYTYTQQEAHLRGQIDILRYLIQSNEESQMYHDLEIAS